MRLRDLVDVESLGLKYVCGEDQDVRVSWVHSTDLPDPSVYLDGGELILTGGLWRVGPDDARRFVDAVSAAGASGLGYGVDDPAGEVPGDVVEACMEVGLALLRVPFELPFVHVVRAFVQHAQQDDESQLRSSLALHEALSAADSAGGMGAILSTLAAQLSRDLWVLDGPGHVWASVQPAPADMLAPAWRHAAAAGAFPTQALLGGGTSVSIFQVDVVAPVRCFVAYGESVGSMPAADLRALREGIPYIRSELARHRERREAAGERARELLQLLDSGRVSSSQIARRLGITAAAEGIRQVVAVLTYPEAPLGLADELSDVARNLFVGNGVREPVIVVPGDRETVVVLSVDARDTSRTTDPQCITRLRAAAAEQLGRRSYLGWTFLQVADDGLLQSIGRARRAARFAGSTGSPGCTAAYERMGSHSVLLDLDADVVEAFQDLVVGDVVSYDAEHGSDLLGTLAAFLDSNGAYKATASVLGLHVNTLRYRLRAVERLTGRDLASMGDRVDLFLALQAHRGRRRAG